MQKTIEHRNKPSFLTLNVLCGICCKVDLILQGGFLEQFSSSGRCRGSSAGKWGAPATCGCCTSSDLHASAGYFWFLFMRKCGLSGSVCLSNIPKQELWILSVAPWNDVSLSNNRRNMQETTSQVVRSACASPTLYSVPRSSPSGLNSNFTFLVTSCSHLLQTVYTIYIQYIYCNLYPFLKNAWLLIRIRNFCRRRCRTSWQQKNREKLGPLAPGNACALLYRWGFLFVCLLNFSAWCN